ncbi:MAG: carbamoyltransferase HypF [Candidatus Omnitrophica bacterium]|nr:carbamoyltransferase HypF [Candidatus Omnitrophota bacterium]
MDNKTACRVKVTGLVQGVGFRPFVYRLARRLSLSGFVCNQRDGVVILAEGQKEILKKFLVLLKREAPPASQIFRIELKEVSPVGYSSFKVAESRGKKEGELFVPPDIATCKECLSEMADPANRRYRYPFINCTNCGPRYSIIKDLPYDRPQTVMTEFRLCQNCSREYRDPADRRYHAEPIACPACGPEISLRHKNVTIKTGDAALREAIRLIKKGRIIAVKGIGGFHLVCDAGNDAAVKRLRNRKKRPIKPLALMARSAKTIKRYAVLSAEAEKLLTGPRRPILLLRKKPGKNNLSAALAPDNNYYGFFLAYAPLHFLLLEGGPAILVATSANLSGEPVICDNNEAEKKLAGITDYFLTHNRKITNQSDDSIFLSFENKNIFIRRSRGYAPLPIITKVKFPAALAFGAEEKGTFAFASGHTVFPSPYLGDLQNYENLQFFEKTLDCYQRFFRIKPEFLVADLHPDYQSRRSAEEMAKKKKLPLFLVQHHKAHIASVLAEYNLKEPVIGVAFDGTGYGEDKTLWGGEFFCGSQQKIERVGSLLPFPLPGGDQAVLQPWRTALGLLHATFGLKIPDLKSLEKIDRNQKTSLLKTLNKNYPFIKTSSAGRLFDATSSLLGLCHQQTYDAEAPIRLQNAAEKAGARLPQFKPYPFTMNEDVDSRLIHAGMTKLKKKGILQIDWRPIITEIVGELQGEKNTETIAARFHLTMAEIIKSACLNLSKKSKINSVILAGGVFQNYLLLKLTMEKLTGAGFSVLIPEKIPINDSGICLGQLLIAKSIF